MGDECLDVGVPDVTPTYTGYARIRAVIPCTRRVIPAQAGIQSFSSAGATTLDARLRGHDDTGSSLP